MAAERTATRASRMEHDTRLARRLAKLKDAAWDAGTALRLQSVIGAAPSLPAPPPSTVFGVAAGYGMHALSPIPGGGLAAMSHGHGHGVGHGAGAPLSSPSSGPPSVPRGGAGSSLGEALSPVMVGVTTDVTLTAGGLDTEPLESPAFAIAATQWMVGGDTAAMFERDWARLQCVHFLSTAKEREALKTTLQRAYGPIRDVFRFYSNVMNLNAAQKLTTAPAAAPSTLSGTGTGGAGRQGSGGAGVASAGQSRPPTGPRGTSGSRGGTRSGVGRGTASGSVGSDDSGDRDPDDARLLSMVSGVGEFKMSRNELETLLR